MKETYTSEKIHTCQKRDIHVRKETYMSEKRPVKQTYHDKKETYMSEKRHTCQKRDIHVRKETRQTDLP